MQTMKAAIYRSYGSPDVVTLEDVPIPTPGNDEVLIRIHATTVNRTDCGFLRAEPWLVRLFSGWLKPKKQILGCEFAGEVVALGADVDTLTVGDRVFAYKDDDLGFGGHAEYTTMPARGMIAKIPPELSMIQAAPALEGAHYALNYIYAAQISASDKVLINGTTGAIGSAAVQLIKHIGAQVTAVCATAQVDQVKALGADYIIDYQQQDFTQLDQTFNVVFDAVGKSTFGQCRRLLTDQGIYVSTELGPYWQNPFIALVTARTKGQQVLFPMPENRPADADYLRDLMQRGVYRPLIDRCYALSDIHKAYHYVETGMKNGNVVIKVIETNKAQP